MSYITISEAAKILGVNKRTLMRWDEDGKLPAKREDVSKIRIYDKATIEKISRWFDLRKRHKEHLKKLGTIQTSIDRFIPTKPLIPGENPRGLSVQETKEMKEAFEARKDWMKKEIEFDKEYAEFREDFYGRLEK